MNEHTTHFGDCGCQTAEHQAELERLKAENARLREVLKELSDACWKAQDWDGTRIGGALDLAEEALRKGEGHEG